MLRKVRIINIHEVDNGRTLFSSRSTQNTSLSLDGVGVLQAAIDVEQYLNLWKRDAFLEDIRRHQYATVGTLQELGFYRLAGFVISIAMDEGTPGEFCNVAPVIDALEHHQRLETAFTAHFDDLNDNGVANLGVEYQRLLIRRVGSRPYGA